MAVTAAFSLIRRPGRLVTCLWILLLFIGSVMAVRTSGIAVDGVTTMQITELRDEGISWLFVVTALVACPREK